MLSWVPARLTALLLHVHFARRASGTPPRRALATLRGEARRTPSPNSGWPMAAMALRLDVRLSKPGVYSLHTGGQVATAGALQAACTVAGQGVVAGAVLMAALAWALKG